MSLIRKHCQKTHLARSQRATYCGLYAAPTAPLGAVNCKRCLSVAGKEPEPKATTLQLI